MMFHKDVCIARFHFGCFHFAGTVFVLDNIRSTTRVCISGYPDNGYPDLSVNFTAAKNPDILK